MIFCRILGFSAEFWRFLHNHLIAVKSPSSENDKITAWVGLGSNYGIFCRILRFSAELLIFGTIRVMAVKSPTYVYEELHRDRWWVRWWARGVLTASWSTTPEFCRISVDSGSSRHVCDHVACCDPSNHLIRDSGLRQAAYLTIWFWICDLIDR